VLQQLTASLDAAAEGTGSLCLISGEAGIGKTRCVDEFALVARRRGLQVWVGRCFEHGSAPAFWPFIQIVRAACGDASLHEKVRNEGETLLREFEPRGPSGPRLPADSNDDRFWLLDRLCRWLCRSATGQVRVVALDDAHCADESSLQALSLLAPLLARSRLLVLVTVRESADALGGRSLSALSSRLRPSEHIPLPALRSEDVQEYLYDVLGDELAVRLSEVLYAKTAGNPLFLHEITRVVSAQYARAGRVEVDAVQLPAAVTEVISARLQQLPPGTRALLDAACVIGDEFGVAVLSRARKLSTGDVLSDLQAAVEAHVVAPQPDGARHAFSHPLMREVLYHALSPARRAQLHADVGLALETLGMMEPPLSELAYHFHHAPLDAIFGRTVRYGRAAGDAAMAAFAYHEAAQFYGWALEAQARAAPEDVAAACELLLVSAAALGLSGRGVAARKQCERAIELASEAELPETLISAARLLRPSVWFAHVADPLALRALERALHLLPESARAQRSRACAQLATLPPYSLRLQSSRQMSDEAVRLANESRDIALQLGAQRSRLFGLCSADSIAEQLNVAEDMLRSDQELAWRWHSDAHFARYHASLQRGDAAAAERALAAYKEFATSRRMRRQLWHCERLRAQRLIDAGQLDRAETRCEQLAHDAEQMCEPLAAAYHRAQRFAINIERTGKRLSVELQEPPAVAGWAQRLPAYSVLRVQLALEQGQRERAEREFLALADGEFAAVRDDAFSLYTLVQLAGIALELSALDSARVLRGLLAQHAELIALSPFTISRGCVARYVGQLEARLGRWREARSYFELASQVNARSGHELQRLHAQLGLAECLARGRTQSERKQARKLTTSVAALAEELGAIALAVNARQLEQPAS
jgi:hypothetical protein